MTLSHVVTLINLGFQTLYYYYIAPINACSVLFIITSKNFFFFNLFLLFQHLIDLAGSESSKTETIGLRRKEGSYINKSLLTLGTVMIIVCLSLFFLNSLHDGCYPRF